MNMNVGIRGAAAIMLAIMVNSTSLRAQFDEWRNYTFTGSINALADDGAYLWIATRGGMLRFTKATGTCEPYTKANTDMVDNEVNGLAIDSSRRVWLAIGNNTNGSVPTAFAAFNGTSWESHPASYSSAKSVAVGHDGTVWCATVSQGQVYRLVKGVPEYVYTPESGFGYEASNLTIDAHGQLWGTFGWGAYLGQLVDVGWAMVQTPLLGFNDGKFSALWPEPDGTMLVGCSNGLARYDLTTATRLLPDTSVALDTAVRFVCRDRRGRIWVITARELAVLENGTWTVHSFASLGMSEYRYPTALVVDKDGIAWIGTNDGLTAFDGATARRYETRVTALPHDAVRAIAFDRKGTAWIGTGSGAARFDGTTWSAFTTSNSGLPGNNVRALAVGHGDSVWFATDQGAALFDGATWRAWTHTNSALPSGALESIAIDRHGNIWAGIGGIDTPPVGIARFDGTSWRTYTRDNTPLPYNGASAIIVDDTNNIWFAMGTRGVARFDGTNWLSFTATDSGASIDMPTSLALDRSGRLTIGTYGAGAFTLEGLKTWQHLRTGFGALISNDVAAVAIDKRGILWYGFGGSRGTERGTQHNDGIHTLLYTRHNSDLPEGNIYTIAFDSSGNVWFGTREGIGVLIGGAVSSVRLPRFDDGAVAGTMPAGMLAVAPNPAHGRAIVSYTLNGNSNANVRLEVIDAMGRTVRTCLDEAQAPGPHSAAIEMRGLPPGWYAVRLTSAGAATAAPLIVAGE